MGFCKNCGNEIDDAAVFCSNCGKTNDNNMYKKNSGGKAITSLVLGIIGVFAWLIPLIGFPVTIVGLVLGIKGINAEYKGMAIAGIVLNIIFLVITIINSAIGAFMGSAGMLY
jgi:uncharacterized membrane protein